MGGTRTEKSDEIKVEKLPEKKIPVHNVKRRPSLVDDCKAPIIDSSDESGEEDEKSGIKMKLDKDSTRYLYAWLNKNLEDPYPTTEQTADLASESGLSVKQVDNWFHKKRRTIGVPEIEKEVPKAKKAKSK